MAKRGFLPCFSAYLTKKYPFSDFYANDVYIGKVKILLSAFVDSTTPLELKEKLGGKMVTPIRPGDSESERILKNCQSVHPLYRIDYGDNPFRIVFGLSNLEGLAYVYIIDTTHDTYSNKHRRSLTIKVVYPTP